MIVVADGVRGELLGFVLPPEPVLRVISGADFLALWVPSEIAAAIAADPRLLAGAFKAASQNSVNLDSDETKQLLALAVSKGALTQARADKIAAGLPPS